MLDSWSEWGSLAAIVVPIAISVAALIVSVRTSSREGRRWREEHSANLRFSRESRSDGWDGDGLNFTIRNIGKAPALDLQARFEFPDGTSTASLAHHPMTLMPQEEYRFEGPWPSFVPHKMPNEDEHGLLWGKAVLEYVDQDSHRLEAVYRMTKRQSGVIYATSAVYRVRVTLDGGRHPQSMANDRNSRRKRTELRADPPTSF